MEEYRAHVADVDGGFFIEQIDSNESETCVPDFDMSHPRNEHFEIVDRVVVVRRAHGFGDGLAEPNADARGVAGAGVGRIDSHASVKLASEVQKNARRGVFVRVKSADRIIVRQQVFDFFHVLRCRPDDALGGDEFPRAWVADAFRPIQNRSPICLRGEPLERGKSCLFGKRKCCAILPGNRMRASDGSSG